MSLTFKGDFPNQEVKNYKRLRSKSIHLSNFDLNCSQKMCYRIILLLYTLYLIFSIYTLYLIFLAIYTLYLTFLSHLYLIPYPTPPPLIVDHLVHISKLILVSLGSKQLTLCNIKQSRSLKF